MASVTICSDFGAQKNKLPHLVCPNHETSSSSSLFPGFALIRWYFAILMCAPSPLYVFLSPLPPPTTHSALSWERKAEMGLSVMGEEALLHGKTKESSPEGQHWRLNTEKEKKWVLNFSRVPCSTSPRGKTSVKTEWGAWLMCLRMRWRQQWPEEAGKGWRMSGMLTGTRVLRLLFWVIQELELKP